MNTKSNINFNTNYDMDYFNMKFQEDHKLNLVSQYYKKLCSFNKFQIFEALEREMEARITETKSVSTTAIHLTFEPFGGGNFFVIGVFFTDYVGNYVALNEEVSTIHLYLYADKDNMPELAEKLREAKFIDREKEEIVNVTWAFREPDGSQNSTIIKASPNKDVKDAYYPWLPEGLNSFYERYENSESPILILLGPPGLGKSSLIRDYMYKYKKKPIITYDIELMLNDQFFIDFIKNDNNLLILEDYDLFLESRDEGKNQIMNKFLNLSEGIVDITKKKIIFTANIEKEQIDPALVRPGRCFKILEFSNYTQVQSAEVIKAAGLPEDTFCQNGMSLAEIFNNRKTTVTKKRKVGF